MKLKKRLFSLFPVISTLHQLSSASGKYGIYVFFQSRTRVFDLHAGSGEAISTLESSVTGSVLTIKKTESNWISLITFGS